MPDHSRRSKKAHMTLEWPKNVIEEMTEVLLSLLYLYHGTLAHDIQLR